MKYIDTPELLKEAVSLISASSWAALDTEADSLHHYLEKLCLVQVTAAAGDFVIDPLVSLDLSPLAQVLAGKFLILHGADFDIRMLKRASLFEPVKIFDTMIAAQLLGYPKQGLADLAEKHCGVSLSKSSQKADWSKRPLDEKLLTYAANDTHYLRDIQSVMEKELRELGRLEWHSQACAKLLESLQEARLPKDPAREWQVKGSKDLKGLALTVFKALWYWREEEAKRRDRPSFKILNAEYLSEIARWTEKNPGNDIAQWKEAPRNVKGEYREALNRLVANAKSLPQAQWVYPETKKPRKKWGEHENQKISALKSEREKIALELKVHPSLLATNAELETIVAAFPRDRASLEAAGCLLPWQIETIGEKFLKVLNATGGAA